MTDNINENGETTLLPDTVDVQYSYDEHRQVERGIVRGVNGSSSYLTVENPAVNQYSPEAAKRSSSFTWIKVLGILSAALLVDVIILTVYLFVDTEPKGLAEEVEEELFNQTGFKSPPDASEELSSFAFGSCSNQHMPMPYWDTITEFQPDVFVMAGDNVYGDCTGDSCLELQEAYNKLAQHPSFQGAKSKLSIVATLDDHDYGLSNCHEDNPHKDLAKQYFMDFFNIQDERRTRTNDGVYHSYVWGPLGKKVQLILLDTRYHRSEFLESDEPGAKTKEQFMPDYSADTKRMLSNDQWIWLQDQLKVPHVNVRIIVSSIQVLADGHGFECWRMLPRERTRLLELLKRSENNVATFLVSGDRHVGGFYEKEGLVEMTTSSLSHTMPLGAYDCGSTAAECDEVDDYRLDQFVRVNNFGTVEIDWRQKQVTLSLRQVDATTESFYQDNWK
eukprot:CAMPEP_0194065942 /NCGR_PEP_ID=MMETSP0009_2-20130614/85750_1 /TAXON_ID=210454 /ORGANISM="Grammatophora oceanica, Strain CCMP 410" /LENGTH=446 /DNA_ID=CAMNT_0038718843 /DNA_START=69 /DNA_END=1406 /DNA_ORIENTATION=-